MGYGVWGITGEFPYIYIYIYIFIYIYIYIRRKTWRILMEFIHGNCHATEVPHNKPDLIIWNCKTKVFMIVEFSCPLNTIKKRQWKT